MKKSENDKLKKIWNKAKICKTHDADFYRLDDCGALIKFEDYGKKTEYGWGLDHTLPVAKKGTARLENLTAMHWTNNLSKADNYPSFTSKVTFNGTKNVEKIQVQEVPIEVQQNLKQIYSNHTQSKTLILNNPPVIESAKLDEFEEVFKALAVIAVKKVITFGMKKVREYLINTEKK